MLMELHAGSRVLHPPLYVFIFFLLAWHIFLGREAANNVVVGIDATEEY